MPGLEVGGLGWTDAEQDSQNLRVGYSLSQLGVEAAAPYLDEPKVECRRVGDRLDVEQRAEVVIVPGNGRKLPLTQGWDRFDKREPRIEIGVVGAAAVPTPPTR